MDQGIISRQVVVEGDKVAFEAGELVAIERVQPNPQNPAYKYVVFSSRLQKWFQLSDNDIRPAQLQQPQQAAPAQVPSMQAPPRQPVPQSVGRPAPRSAAPRWRKIVIIGLAILVIAALAVGITLWLGKSKKKTPSTTWTSTGGAVTTFNVGPFA